MKEDAMQLTLTPQEQEVLLEAVKSAISDLGTEIGHTDKQAMREGLQQSKKVLLELLDRLNALSEGVSPPDAKAPRVAGIRASS